MIDLRYGRSREHNQADLAVGLPHGHTFVRAQLLGALHRVILARNHVLHQAAAIEIFLPFWADLASEQFQLVPFT